MLRKLKKIRNGKEKGRRKCRWDNFKDKVKKF